MPMPISAAQPDKASYLLHIWQESDGYAPVWRASVTVVVDGQRLGFPHPEAALHFLAATLRETQYSAFDRPTPAYRSAPTNHSTSASGSIGIPSAGSE